LFNISNITLSYSGVELFSNISFMINPRDRIGLVGKNGAGKTSLLNIIAGKQQVDTGVVSFPDGKSIGYLPQEIRVDSNLSVYVETQNAFKEIKALEVEIEKINQKLLEFTDYESDVYLKLIDKLNTLHHRFDYFEGSKQEGQIEKTLKGLGFKEADLKRSMNEFSGGWQMRVELAKILLTLPDLILLDEPTNHLDIESIIWLEETLKNYPGAVMMVSHDRMFLDNITSRTIEIVNGRHYDYKLPYSKFLDARKERIDGQIAAAKNQDQFIKTQERFIERFRAKNTKAKQVQSKLKQLDKIERVEVDDYDVSHIQFRFPQAPRSGAVVVEAKELTKNYGNLNVLKDVNFEIERGERVAFVGKNGEGKTTMVRIILDELEHDGGAKLGYNVEVGYYAQIQEKTLDDNDTVYDTLRNIATGDWTNEAKLRGLLGAFLFRENDMDKKVKVLSGGEKSRLAIARLLLNPVNLLILDEPTNHLDIPSKEVLKNALLRYDGTLILVSHDRDFLQGLTNRTFEFTNKNIKEHLGTIDDFLHNHRIETFREFEKNKKQSKVAKPSASNNKERFEQKKNLEKDIRKLSNKLSKTEKEISEAEKKVKDIETQMQTPDFYEDPDKAKQISQEHDDLNNLILEKMEEWEEMHEELEKLREEYKEF
jgi:ATP-binding cassette subfamily F protein 3